MWDNLKASIAAVVRTNNNQEITGANLQNVLNTIVNSIGANATFAGIATPSTSPGTPDGPVFWIAGPGTYSNFGQLTVVGDTLGVFVWSNSAWHYDSILSLIIDDEPTAGSNNPAKSGGIVNMYGHYSNQPEYLYVITDYEGRLLFAIKRDGDIVFSAGIPNQVKEYVESAIDAILEGNDTEQITY